IQNGSDLLSRKAFAGHVTCGAVLLDARWRVLHLAHNALSRWLLPGGHLEPEDDSLPAAALREVHEETGIAATALTPLAGFESSPLDVDVHQIPANPRRDEPEHWHFDFRYAFHVAGAPVIRLQTEEVSRYRWLTPDAVPAARVRLKLHRIA